MPRTTAASPCARSGEGWRVYSRHEYAPVVERFLLEGQRARLTQASLETLAVIAYRQPVSRSRVSAVRGVNVDGVIRTLLRPWAHHRGAATTRTPRPSFRHDAATSWSGWGSTSLDDAAARSRRPGYLPEVDVLGRDRGGRGRRPIRSRAHGHERRRPRPRGCPPAEAPGRRRGGLATGVRAAHHRGPGRGRRADRHRARRADRAHPDRARRRRAGPARRVARLPRLQQAPGRRHVDERRPRPYRRRRLPPWAQGATVPRRPTRRRHRGAAPADERRRRSPTDFSTRATASPRPTSPRCRGRCRATSGRRLREGVELEDGPVDGRLVQGRRLPVPGKALVEVVLHEGRKHIVRRLLAEVSATRALARAHPGRPHHASAHQAGPVARPLTRDEVGRLYAAAGL